MAESITLTADRSAKADEIAATVGLTREQFLQAEADTRLDEQLSIQYDDWFVSVDLATKKAIYNANQ